VLNELLFFGGGGGGGGGSHTGITCVYMFKISL
jgi:hypothetical protein